MEIIGYFGALVVGLVLGTIGSGGALLAIPIFSYLFHISPVTTTAYSLFVVGTSASMGSYHNLKKGLVDGKTAFVFALPAFTTVFAVRKFAMPILPEELFRLRDFIITKDMAIMVFFAFVLVWASIFMIRKKSIEINKSSRTSCDYPILLIQGIVVGIIMGIIGVGGGFLIIPVLLFCTQMPMAKAVATSLLIISLTSLIGFTGSLGNLYIDWIFLLSFTLISLLGIYLGIVFSKYINSEKLKKTFGWLALGMALFILYTEIMV